MFEIFALNVWLALSFLVGRAIWRFTYAKTLAITIAVVVAVAPYWNVLPSYFAFRDAVAKDGGTRISRRVDADSFLIKHKSEFGDVLSRCGSTKFCEPVLFEKLAAAEFPELPSKATPTRQFVRLSIGKTGDPRCAELAEYSKQSSPDWFWNLRSGHCFATDHLVEPTSTYSIEESVAGPLPAWNSIPLRRSESIVRKIATGEIVAQSVRYTAEPLPLWSAMAGFKFENGVAELTPEALRK